MCLGIPMKILTKKNDKAVVSSGGIKRGISIALIRNAKIGDYVIVHAGFAIEKLNESRARETLKMLRQIKPVSKL